MLAQDLRHALRMLARQPALAVVGGLTLALGIGATTAVWSVVRGVLLQPLPYPDSGRLALLWETSEAFGLPAMYASAPNFADWQREAKSFAAMAAVHPESFTVLLDRSPARTPSRLGSEPVRLPGARATAGLFATLGVAPAAGRGFRPEDDRPGGAPVVVVGDALARRLGGGEAAVGRTLTIEGRPHEVVGVAPPGFTFPPPIALEGLPSGETPELWVPLAAGPGGSRGAHNLTVVARLAPDVTPARAQAEMTALAARLARAHPDSNAGWGVHLVPLAEQVTGPVRPPLLALAGAVGFVLLLACANVANLLLMRAVGRRRELAVRAALGAGRRRLLAQVATESLLLALLGGVAGLLLAVWTVRLLVRLAPADLPRITEVTVDGGVLAFAAAATVFSGLLFGLAPALQLSPGRLAGWLRDRGAGGGGGGGARRARRLLVVGEMALAVVLLAGAGLMLRSFLRLRAVDPGFRPTEVLALSTVLPDAVYTADAQRAAFLEAALAGLRALPGVRAAGAVTDLPLAADRQGTSVWFEGEPEPEDAAGRIVNFTFVSAGYFETLGVAVRRGRPIDAADRAGAPRVATVNEAFVRRFAPGGEPLGPLGRRILLGFDAGSAWEIVGVVADVRHAALGQEVGPNVYLPYPQLAAMPELTFVVRGASGAGDAGAARRAASQALAALAADAHRAIRAAGPAVPVHSERGLAQVVARSIARPRFFSGLLAAFSGIALVLAAVGLYGVISYAVGERRGEIGVRVALGAAPRQVLGLVVGDAMALAAAGLAAGAAAALALGRLLAGLLYEIRPTDPWTFLTVSALLGAVALAAAWLPARRALAVEPVTALRAD